MKRKTGFKTYIADVININYVTCFIGVTSRSMHLHPSNDKYNVCEVNACQNTADDVSQAIMLLFRRYFQTFCPTFSLSINNTESSVTGSFSCRKEIQVTSRHRK